MRIYYNLNVILTLCFFYLPKLQSTTEKHDTGKYELKRYRSVIRTQEGLLIELPARITKEYGTFEKDFPPAVATQILSRKNICKSVAFALSVLSSVPHAGPAKKFFESLEGKEDRAYLLDIAPVFQIATCTTHLLQTYWAYDELIDSFNKDSYINKKRTLAIAILVGLIGETGTVLTTYFYFQKDLIWPLIKLISTEAFPIKSMFDLQTSLMNGEACSAYKKDNRSMSSTLLTVFLASLGATSLYTRGKTTTNLLERMDLSTPLAITLGCLSTLPSSWLFIMEIPSRISKILTDSTSRKFSRKLLSRLSLTLTVLLVLSSLVDPLYIIEDNFDGISQEAFMISKTLDHIAVSSFCCFSIIYRTFDTIRPLQEKTDCTLPLVDLAEQTKATL